MKKMILDNHGVTIREVADNVCISFGSCQVIFTDVLDIKRAAAMVVPNDDPDLFKKVITVDESWLFGYDIETKAQPSQWKHREKPRLIKASQVRSNAKVLLTVFFDCNDVVY